jgi:hypothetical protein
MNNAAGRPPSRDQGWGRVNLSRTLAFTNSEHSLLISDRPPTFAATEDPPYTAYLDVMSTDLPLKVTLVWSDYPATPGAGKQLVNDLDLLVRAPSLSFAGNALSNGWSFSGDAFDRTNNVEQVNWLDPSTGIVEISVWPHVIPEATQDFAVVATGGFAGWPLDRDDDGDLLPDYWELFHFGELTVAGTNDSDSDGLSNYGEFTAGTDPNDTGDVLQLVSFSTTPASNGVVLRWQSAADRRYAVTMRPNLATGAWDMVINDILATEPMNTVTIPAPSQVESFYRVVVEQ